MSWKCGKLKPADLHDNVRADAHEWLFLLQGELPRLRDARRSELVIRFLLDQPEAERFVDSACRMQNAIGP